MTGKLDLEKITTPKKWKQKGGANTVRRGVYRKGLRVESLKLDATVRRQQSTIIISAGVRKKVENAAWRTIFSSVRSPLLPLPEEVGRGAVDLTEVSSRPRSKI